MKRKSRATDAERFEIIETYWNVNQPQEQRHVRALWEIIETYWNVNSREQ